MSTTFDTGRARLTEYAPWIMRDYLTNQGPSTAIVVLLIGLLTLLPYGAATGSLATMPTEVAARFLRGLVGILAFLGTFFATNGIVATDRKQGYYKFLFSKPMRPTSYYAMVFGVYGAGLLIVTLALLGAWSIAVRPMLPLEMFGVVLVMYLALGGIGFLLSAAWRFDWISLVSVYLVARIGWTLWGSATGWRSWLLHLLPPVHRTDDVYALVMRDSTATVPWTSIAWLAGYGLVCFALGILVIRKRPLGTS